MERNRSADELSTMMLVNDVSKLFHDRMRNETSKRGINSSYRPILFHLSRNDGMTQLEIVKATHHKAPSISVMLQKMEAEGLIRREADKKDMRQVRIYLTEEGRLVNEQIRSLAHSVDEYCMEGITEDEIAVAKECLIKMREKLLLNERKTV